MRIAESVGSDPSTVLSCPAVSVREFGGDDIPYEEVSLSHSLSLSLVSSNETVLLTLLTLGYGSRPLESSEGQSEM